MPKINKRVLVIAPAWVGDMVMAQTLFILLKSQGVSHLAVLAPKWTLEVAKRMPEVDETILGDFAHGQIAFGQRKNLGKSLIGQFDEAIVLPKSFKSALVPFFANISTRIGYLGEFRYGLLTEPRKLEIQKLPKTIDRFAYLGIQKDESVPVLSYPNLFIDKENQQHLKAKFNLSKPLLTLCPGAEYGPSKQWPLHYVADVANRAIENGYDVIALGSGKDSTYIETIQKTAPDVINLAGKTSIPDAIDLLAMTDKALTNDSGLMHIAAATNATVFAVYGSTTTKMTPPLTDNAVIFADNTLPCRPCFKRECPKTGDDFMRCMDYTTHEMVWQKMQTFDEIVD